MSEDDLAFGKAIHQRILEGGEPDWDVLTDEIKAWVERGAAKPATALALLAERLGAGQEAMDYLVDRVEDGDLRADMTAMITENTRTTDTVIVGRSLGAEIAKLNAWPGQLGFLEAKTLPNMERLEFFEAIPAQTDVFRHRREFVGKRAHQNAATKTSNKRSRAGAYKGSKAAKKASRPKKGKR